MSSFSLDLGIHNRYSTRAPYFLRRFETFRVFPRQLKAAARLGSRSLVLPEGQSHSSARLPDSSSTGVSAQSHQDISGSSFKLDITAKPVIQRSTTTQNTLHQLLGDEERGWGLGREENLGRHKLWGQGIGKVSDGGSEYSSQQHIDMTTSTAKSIPRRRIRRGN